MTFYINSNLSPTEAVKMHPELQVHPIIEQWAQAAEKDIEAVEAKSFDEGYHEGYSCSQENIRDKLNYIINNEDIINFEQLLDAIVDLENEL